VRFDVSRALDAVEQRLSVDPLRAGAIVDVAEAIRRSDLDGGRPVALLRLGQFVDALGRLLGDAGVALYVIAERGILSDTDLTANERMVLRRWADDGLIELLPAGAQLPARVSEAAALTGLPVITQAASAHPPSPVYRLVAASGGAKLTVEPSTGPAPRPHPVSLRLWRCPAPGCASFGTRPDEDGSQPPPVLRGGVPVCPRHDERLVDAGPRPHAIAVVVRTGGVARCRFAVAAGHQVAVGRSPDQAGSVMIAPWLRHEATRRVSRTHLMLEARDGLVAVTDVSKNGSAVLARTSAGQPPRRVPLTRGQPYLLGEWDAVELHTDVTLTRADRPPPGPPVATPESVLVDAPTVQLRLPRVR
jgi:hypothetical protein